MKTKFSYLISLFVCLSFCEIIDPLSKHNLGTPIDSNKTNFLSNKTELGFCHICRYFANSFNNFYKQIGRKKVKEGQAHWNMNNLILNDSSKSILHKIKSLVCTELVVGKEECLKLFHKHEASVNYWWNNKKQENEDLFKYLCINILSVCCPKGHYGNNCKKCPGSPFNVCSKNGYCKGDGTKKGSGKCVCNKGYIGENCEKCDSGYYLNKTDLSKKSKNENQTMSKPTTHDKVQTKIICLPCDNSCALNCNKKGPKGCESCKTGYFWDNEYGCVDIDECNEMKRKPCSKNTFCINTEGSYICYDCDKACKECIGDGPDMCLECAEDFKLEGKICVSTKQTDQDNKMEMSRYVTYLGLCLATCIIFRNNIFIASIIGMIVATYIGIAEYTIGGGSIQWVNKIMKNFLR